MDQRQFEQAVQHMAQTEGADRLTPADVARRLGIEQKDAERLLDRMVTEGRLELDSDDDGNLFYFVPGIGTGGVFTTASGLGPAPLPADQPPNTGAPQAPGQPPQQQPPWQRPPSPWQPQNPYAPQTGAPPAGYPSTGYPQPGPSYAPPYAQQPYPGQPHPGPQYPQQQQPGWSPPQPGGWRGPGAPQQQPGWTPGQQGPWQPPNPYAPQPQQQQQPWGQQPYNPYAQQPSTAMQPWGPGYPGQHAMMPVAQEPKSPGTAAILSLFFPGAGQLYNGQIGKGLTFFFLTMILFMPVYSIPLALVPYIWSVVDAYNTSRRINVYGLLPP